jgi:hypothetical protein
MHKKWELEYTRTILLLGRDLRRGTRGFSSMLSESSELELDMAGNGLISTFAD